MHKSLNLFLEKKVLFLMKILKSNYLARSRRSKCQFSFLNVFSCKKKKPIPPLAHTQYGGNNPESVSFLLNPAASRPITPGGEPRGVERAPAWGQDPDGRVRQVAPADWAKDFLAVTMGTHVLGPVLGQDQPSGVRPGNTRAATPPPGARVGQPCCAVTEPAGRASPSLRASGTWPAPRTEQGPHLSGWRVRGARTRPAISPGARPSLLPVCPPVG